ncbi:hypothetical protein TBCH5v1_2537 [Thermococcus barophilus]|uniref:Uncharacterized protein n=1 Tax=Thermococcus barophilus TaxID=55802 RepID=A0A0S1XF74_THEBA|nr:hypothetical protein TBCH5v1_2537 [Thermococcus barophilus]
MGFVSPNGDGKRKMWGVSVPPESQPMKIGGWKVSRNGAYELQDKSYG